MLWYKGWLETRIKFLFAFAFIGFLLYMMQSPHKSPATVSIFLPGTAPIFVFMVCVLVAGAGIATQPPFQATKGLHGSMLFTLSLPVSRLRLLAVRATLGWLEMAVLVGFLCCGIWTLSPIVRILNTPAEMFEFAATLLACASSLYGLSVLLATFLDDQWRVWGTMLCIGAVWWLSLHNSLPLHRYPARYGQRFPPDRPHHALARNGLLPRARRCLFLRSPQSRPIPRILKRGSPTMAFNPDDTRIVVPKRTRLGWTLNMGRPLAWLVLALVIAAAIAIGYINSRH